MRILHLVHQYLPDKIGGTERYTQSIARTLTTRGHEVSVFYRRSAEGAGLARRNEDGVTVWAAWAGSPSPTRRFLATFGDAAIARAFQDVLDQARPELVHVQHLMGLPARLLDVIYWRHIPMVVTLHDYWWVCANAQLLTNYDQQVCDGPKVGWLNCGRCALARGGMGGLWPAAPALTPLLAVRERLLRRALGRAARCIAPTRFVKDWYVAHGLAADRIDVLSHGIQLPDRPPAPQAPSSPPLRLQPETELAGADPDNHPLRVAYIGGLSWQKGVHVLVEAFKSLSPDAELWIAGDEAFDPDYSGSLRASAGPNVRFLGALSHAQVWDALGRVDAVAVPSLWYETFSLIVHEAFAAGRSVIASRLGALAEVVRDGVDGLLVTPGDVTAWQAALARLAQEPQFRRQLAAGIRPTLTLREHVGRLEAIYVQVVGGSQDRS